MYNRGVRVHKLMYESLVRLAWQDFIPWIESNYANQLHIIIRQKVSLLVISVIAYMGTMMCLKKL